MPIPSYLRTKDESGFSEDVRAPMPGVIEKVMVAPGTQVQKGDPLVVMIAMKMEVLSASFLSSHVQYHQKIGRFLLLFMWLPATSILY